MRLDDPKSNQIRGLKRLPRNIAASSPLGFSSVSEGQTQFIGELSILIVGSGRVTGTWEIRGELKGDGTINWTGDINLSDDGKVTVDGAIPVTLGMTSAGLPGLEFSSGGRVIGNASGVVMLSPGGGELVYAYNGVAGLSNGSNGVDVGDTGTEVSGKITALADVYMSGLPTKSGTGLLAGLLWIDPTTKRLYRIIS